MAFAAEWRKAVTRGFTLQTPALFLLAVLIIYQLNDAYEHQPGPSVDDMIHYQSTFGEATDSSPKQAVDSDGSETRLKRNFMRFGRDVSSGEKSLRICYPVSNREMVYLHRFLSAVKQRPGGKRFMRFGRSGPAEVSSDDDDHQLVWDDDDTIDQYSRSTEDAALKRFMRFGKRFMRFGRQSSDNYSSSRPVTGVVICFRKDDGVTSSLPDKRFMRFGRIPEPMGVVAEEALAVPRLSDENA